jgi:hypothetical protein
MFRDKVIDVLKSKNDDDKRTNQAMNKIEKQKRLSSEEFLKVQESLWKEGPSVKYQNPDSWNKEMPEKKVRH